jgi:hypothetical protein
VSGSVAVAADDGEAGLGDAELRPDDVDDALILAVHVEQGNARFAAVAFEGFELAARVGVEDGKLAVFRGDGMIHHREGKLGLAHLASGRFEPRERLRRSPFMNQVAVDVNQGGLAGFFSNNVCGPDFFVECARRHARSDTL